MAGNKLFGVDIAKILRDETKGQLLDATLIKITEGTRTPGALTAGTNPTTANKTAEGFIDSQDRKDVNGTLVENGNVIVLLIGNSIEDAAVPEVDDKVTIESVTYWIKALDRDPAKATYTLLCKVV